MRQLLFIFLFTFSFFSSCSNNDYKNSRDKKEDKIPTDIEKPAEATKPIQMWIDAHANFSRFANKENITSYMEKMKETGFNEVYVDVKPGIGYALYDSDILPQLTKWDNETVDRDWDYLAFWIEEAERLDMKVIASLSVMGFGYTKTKEGLIYDSDRWNGKTQVEMPDNNPDNLVDIRDQTNVDAAMLNPSLPEVQSFIISIIEEIVTKYPDLKGLCLDYCRWYGGNYGFSDATIDAFEAYSGLAVTNKNDIITSTGGIGPLYSQWIEFRSMTITNLITNIRSKVKLINPGMELHLWASAHWNSRYSVGQNWASKDYKPTGSGIYTETYSKTGFADQIDVFSLGAYAEYVWKSENPNSEWSVENFATTYSNYTMEDCHVYGSIGTYAYGDKASAVSDAVHLCLKNTDGIMVFEISHVINNNQWNAIKEGIKRYINS
ncbi:family 10 glycosylhydrolase [Proteiniphilum acetatigenes]|uniref:family 10 glycosylhydrolase n=1 Tax=Proteiniphilum acetatigenes TaxID=294710 RepID=UPI00035CB9F0|nr:family 10 glycosylhydrolase [Proteiniphilum acetatigenes]